MLIFGQMHAALSGDSVLISVMLQQYKCVMEQYTNYTFLLYMKICLPSNLILRYVRAKMIKLHEFMNLINWTIDIQENLRNYEIVYTTSKES